METPPTAGCQAESKRVKEQMILDTQAGTHQSALDCEQDFSKTKHSKKKRKKTVLKLLPSLSFIDLKKKDADTFTLQVS